MSCNCSKPCNCSNPATAIPNLIIQRASEPCGGSNATPFECITQTSSYLAPEVGDSVSFVVATIDGYYVTGTYLHVFNAAGLAWVGRIIQIIDKESLITVERVAFEGTVDAGTNMGMRVCLLNAGAVLPAQTETCNPSVATIKESIVIPADGVAGTATVNGCWTYHVGQTLYIAGLGWIRVQSIVSAGSEGTTFTYLVTQLATGITNGASVPTGSVVFPDIYQPATVSGGGGGDTEQTLAQFWELQGSGLFGDTPVIFPFAGYITALYSVEYAGNASNTGDYAATKHYHWDLLANGERKNDASGGNDASGTYLMGRSSTGFVGWRIGAPATINIRVARNTATPAGGGTFPTEERVRVQLTLHRERGNV